MKDSGRQMDCLDMQELLFELRGGEFDAATADAVRAHVADCTRCRAVATFDRRLTDLLRIGAAEPPVGLTARVKGRLHRRRRRVAAVAFASAAAILVAGVLSVWRPGSDPAWRSWNRITTASAPPDDIADLAALFGAAAVDSLDVLAREQSGYVAMLNRLGKE